MNKLADPLPQASFAAPDDLPGALSGSVAASLIAAVGDVSLILSREGTILDVSVSEGDLANRGFASWVGEAWHDVVTVESRPKIEEMLAAADQPEGRERWRQVNHPAAGGDVPIRYIVVALGTGGRLVAIGRDMRGAAVMQQRLLQTQQSLERDYLRLRQAETRYRMLFDLAAEAMLMVDVDTRRIREVNPAAQDLLGAADRSLVGQSVATIVDADQREDFVTRLGAAGIADDPAPIPVRLRDAQGRRGVEVSATVRLFRQGRASLFLIRLAAAGRDVADQAPAPALGEVVERMPDAFVLASRDMTVLSGNAAFVELAEAVSVERIVGARLGTWLGRPGIDLDLIAAQLREHGSVRNVATIMRGAGGVEEEVEVSGVVAPLDGDICYGFVVRSVARRLRDAPAVPRDMPRSVEQLTELVGRVSLKDIVRESTDLIERLCIEAALTYTLDNRASAAEMLGVSRQSLYSKLHRHGIGNLATGDE